MKRELLLVVFFIGYVECAGCPAQSDFYPMFAPGSSCPVGTPVVTTDTTLTDCRCACRSVPGCGSIIWTGADGSPPSECKLLHHACADDELQSVDPSVHTYNRWGVRNSFRGLVEVTMSLPASVQMEKPFDSGHDGSKAVDGDLNSCVVSISTIPSAWWYVQLKKTETIYAMKIKKRDVWLRERTGDFLVYVSGQLCLNQSGEVAETENWIRPLFCQTPRTGNNVNMTREIAPGGEDAMQLCEIAFFTWDQPEAAPEYVTTTTDTPTTTTPTPGPVVAPPGPTTTAIPGPVVAPPGPTTTATPGPVVAPPGPATTTPVAPLTPSGIWFEVATCTGAGDLIATFAEGRLGTRSEVECAGMCARDPDCESCRLDGACQLFKNNCTGGSGGWAVVP